MIKTVIFDYAGVVKKSQELSLDIVDLYKIPIEEYETEISNVGEFRKILNFLDFKKVVTIDKQREYWDCGDLEIALDKVEGLGSFIEVEAKGNLRSTAEAKQACLKFLDGLGIKNAENTQINKGYPVLLLEKNKS